MRFLLGLVFGILLVPAVVFFYFRSGRVPVAVADASFPLEMKIVHVPLKARIEREMPKSVPIEPSETNLLAGASIYRELCAGCHGGYGRVSGFGSQMFPRSPQLWAPHHNGVVGVSDDPPGEIYWKVKNGIRLSGMPAYVNLLNDTQMWQVTLLLANADKPQPAEVMTLLKQPLP